MINDDLTKKLAEAAKKVLANDNTNDKSDDGEGLDKVQPKAVKKKFDDRKDKDIDNDGDVDSSDEYLHKRRKAISKATTEETELEEATELYKKGKMTLTKFAMGKGKGVGLQINYGMKFIQIPEKDIKQLAQGITYVTKSVSQFKEEVELEEAVKFWTVTITKKAGKLFKGQTVDVKASNSAEAIKKGIKQMKGNPALVPGGSVDAVLGESIEESNKDKYMWGDINKAMSSAGLNPRAIMNVLSKLKGKAIK